MESLRAAEKCIQLPKEKLDGIMLESCWWNTV